MLDLDYSEDSAAAVDLNVVRLGNGGLVEVQGTGEGGTFSVRRARRPPRSERAGHRSVDPRPARCPRPRLAAGRMTLAGFTINPIIHASWQRLNNAFSILT